MTAYNKATKVFNSTTEDYLRAMARMSSYPVEICQKFEELADMCEKHDKGKKELKL